MSNEIFLHIYVRGDKTPLYCTLNSMQDMVSDGDWYIFPSTRGKRFMIRKDQISRIETQENKPTKTSRKNAGSTAQEESWATYQED